MKKKFRNPNTSKLWDRLLVEKNSELIQSPIYKDKIYRVFKFLKKKWGNFLDVGIGMANLEKKLVDHRLNLNIYGVDISHKAIASAKMEIKGKFLVANIFKLPFDKDFFNVVVILDVIEHIEKDRIIAGLKGVWYVLKRSGDLIISVPLNENLKQLNRRGENYNRHLREYTLKILTEELNKSGFRIFKHEYLYAFRKYYKSKSFVMKVAPFLRKPNLLIVYAKKK